MTMPPDDKSHPPTSAPAGKRVLVGISSYEREYLFAGSIDSLRHLAAAEVKVQLCEGTDAGGWEKILRAFRPEILVVGWAVPVLPDGYFDEPDCPVRYVCFLTGSVRRIVPRSFVARGGLVTNWGDDAAPMVAEHALLLLLAALRRLPEWRPYMDRPLSQQHTEPVPLATRTLHDQTVGVHGFGRIARAFIRLVAPFNVKIRAYSHGVPDDYIRAHGAEPVASLAALFDGAEILVECEALNAHTHQSVNHTVIDRLAAGAIFVNVGRGAVVEEAALARRAAAGDLHLALDVMEVEPLPLDSPLRRIPSVLLSPHIAGPTRERLSGLGARAIANLNHYLGGQTPLDLITPEIYDRST